MSNESPLSALDSVLSELALRHPSLVVIVGDGARACGLST
jgi:hypothetical protein